MEQADLGLALYDFVAAFGLLGSYNIFRNSRAGDRISPPNLLKLTQTFCRLWLGMAAIESLGSIVLASDMNIPYASFVAISLFAANLFAGEWFHRRTLSKEDQPALASEYAPARTNGIKVSRNMIGYAGTLGITALVELTNAVLQTFRAETTEEWEQSLVEFWTSMSPLVLQDYWPRFTKPYFEQYLHPLNEILTTEIPLLWIIIRRKLNFTEESAASSNIRHSSLY